jgi:hypothetical protein
MVSTRKEMDDRNRRVVCEETLPRFLYQWERDKNHPGNASIAARNQRLASTAYYIGAASWICDPEPGVFRLWMQRAGSCIARCEELNAVDREAASAKHSSYGSLYYALAALAAGDVALARKAVALFADDNVNDSKPGSDVVHWGRAGKWVILDQHDNAEADLRWLETRRMEVKSGGIFSGQTALLRPLLDRDVTAFSEAISEFLKGYGRVKQHYWNGGDELLCVHGLAWINLARSYGMDTASPNETWCPSDLLCTYS